MKPTVDEILLVYIVIAASSFCGVALALALLTR